MGQMADVVSGREDGNREKTDEECGGTEWGKRGGGMGSRAGCVRRGGASQDMFITRMMLV